MGWTDCTWHLGTQRGRWGIERISSLTSWEVSKSQQFAGLWGVKLRGIALGTFLKNKSICIFLNWCLFIYLFIFWSHCEACGILVLWPGIEPRPPALEAQSPNHWTTWEVPHLILKSWSDLGWCLRSSKVIGFEDVSSSCSALPRETGRHRKAFWQKRDVTALIMKSAMHLTKGKTHASWTLRFSQSFSNSGEAAIVSFVLQLRKLVKAKPAQNLNFQRSANHRCTYLLLLFLFKYKHKERLKFPKDTS